MFVFKPKHGGIIAFVLVLSLALSLPVQAAAPTTPDIQTGSFTFAAHDVSGRDLTDHYIYTDQFFANSSYSYNAHLATMSMILAAASISSKAVGDDYTQKSKNISKLLADLGFSDFETNDCYKQQPGEQTMGVACAHKTITASDGSTSTLLVIVPRSAGYEREWAGNFTVGHSDSGTDLHKGFLSARTYVMDFARSYVTAHNITGGSVKVWTMGYSRGAATANLTAGLLDDSPTALGNGVTLKPENVYAYTFGTPLCAPTSLKPDADLYKNINNLFADYDPISMLVPAAWGFSRYGVTTYLPVHDSAAKTKMLAFLKATNPTVYATYTAENSGADPDNFKPLKFQLANSKLSVVYDADSAGAASKASQQAFLADRIKALTNSITTRNDYADNYESMLANFMSLYFGMSDDDYAAFNSSIGGNKLASITAGLLYATYVTGTYSNDTDTLLAQLQAVDKQIQSDESYSQYTSTNDYKAFSDELQAMTSETFKSDYSTVYAKLQSFTDAAVKAVFSEALTAVNASEETRSKILADSAVTALRKFVSDMMFSPASTDTLESAFKIDAPPLSRAATLIGNAGSYMRVHNNEIILSWVRTMDDWYAPAGSGSSTSPSVTPSPSGSSYAEQKDTARSWAVSKGILFGDGSGGYALDDVCTRGQAATLLWRAAGSPAPSAASVGFSDVPDSSYCSSAVRWLSEQGISTGTGAARYSPDSTLTRAQAVTLLYRLASSPDTASAVTFSDVPSGAWYARSVSWAVKKGITLGTGPDSFSPDDTCTRGQFLLFLYRFYQ